MILSYGFGSIASSLSLLPLSPFHSIRFGHSRELDQIVRPLLRSWARVQRV